MARDLAATQIAEPLRLTTNVSDMDGTQCGSRGRMVQAVSTVSESVIHYDTQGRLIAETDPAGNLKREVIYLADIPVGVVK